MTNETSIVGICCKATIVGNHMLTSKNAAVQPKQSNHNRPESTKSHNTTPPHKHTHVLLLSYKHTGIKTSSAHPKASDLYFLTNTHSQLSTGTHLSNKSIAADKSRDRVQLGWEVFIKQPKKRNSSFTLSRPFLQEMANILNAAMLVLLFLYPPPTPPCFET